MATKFEIERFDGKGDFSLWKKKIKALLVQQKVAKALDKKIDLFATLKPEEIEEMKDIAFSTIILYLAVNVLRQINDAKSANVVWTQLNAIYLTKSLTNKLYIKKRFFGFKIDSSKDQEHNLDEFNRILLDLSNIGETMSNENKAIILMNSLLESYNAIKMAIKYGRDSLTIDSVLNAS